MTPNVSLVRPLSGALLALALLTAACGSSSVPASPEVTASPSTGPGATVTPAAAEPTPVPGASDAPGIGSGGGYAGGSAPGNPGNPGSSGPIVYPGPDGNLPPVPEPTLVTPTAGLTGVHAVQAANLEAAVDGRDVTVRVAWWSGVAPCSALAGITVTRDGGTFLLTVNEGSAASPDQACIDIAMYKAGLVDLGELEPGSYTIKALGDAPPVEVTVAG